jgi:hypothetical protein
MRRVLLVLALAALPAALAEAQQAPPRPGQLFREGFDLRKAEADALEATLAGKPDDLAARFKLLVNIIVGRDGGLRASP